MTALGSYCWNSEKLAFPCCWPIKIYILHISLLSFLPWISIEIPRIRGRKFQNSPHHPHLALHHSPSLPSQDPPRPLGSCNLQSPQSPCGRTLPSPLPSPSPPQSVGGRRGCMRKMGADSCYWCRNWLLAHIFGLFEMSDYAVTRTRTKYLQNYPQFFLLHINEGRYLILRDDSWSATKEPCWKWLN